MTKKYQAVIALDWADKKHDGYWLAQGMAEPQRFRLVQKPEAIAEWVTGLQRKFPGGKFAVTLEQKRGALISALLKYDCFDIYPLNPATLAKYREAFTPSRAKDDPYAMQRLKGKSHPIAVRALPYKWIRIVFRLWKDRKTYCEATYLAALQRNGSPIIKFLAEHPNLENTKFSTT